MRIALLCFLSFLFSGCVYYTNRICPEDMRVDVPYFDGQYSFRALDQKSFGLISFPVKGERVDSGEYDSPTMVPGVGRANTCVIGNKTIVERAVLFDDGTKYFISMVIRDVTAGFSMGHSFVDPTTLDEMGVPYKVLGSTECKDTPLMSAKFDGLKSQLQIPKAGFFNCLIVDNSPKFVTPTQLAEKIYDTSFSWTFVK